MRTLISIVVVILIFKWFFSEPKQVKSEPALIEKIEMVETIEFDTIQVCTKEGCKNVTMEDRRKAAEEAQRIIDEIMK